MQFVPCQGIYNVRMIGNYSSMRSFHYISSLTTEMIDSCCCNVSEYYHTASHIDSTPEHNNYPANCATVGNASDCSVLPWHSNYYCSSSMTASHSPDTSTSDSDSGYPCLSSACLNCSNTVGEERQICCSLSSFHYYTQHLYIYMISGA